VRTGLGCKRKKRLGERLWCVGLGDKDSRLKKRVSEMRLLLQLAKKETVGVIPQKYRQYEIRWNTDSVAVGMTSTVCF